MGIESVRERLLAKFKDISKERIQKLNRGILALEKNPDNTPQIAEVMREIHTIKGESRMMEFLGVSAIAHSIEDLLKALKDKAFIMHRSSTDILFQSLDALTLMIDKGEKDAAAQVDVNSLKARLAMEADGVKKRGLGAPEAAPGEKKKTASAVDVIPGAETGDILRVRANELDALAGLVGDIFLAQNRTRAFLQQVALLQDLIEHGKEDVLARVRTGLERLHTLAKDRSMEMDTFLSRLDDQVRQIRLLPFSTIFDLYPRAIRDMSKDHGKEIDVVIVGADTRADKRLLDELQTPLVHIIRNAVDHGIEAPAQRQKVGKPTAGVIRISAALAGDRVHVTVEDDGRGLDPGAIRRAAVSKGLLSEEEAADLSDDKAIDMIFNAGFSTKDVATETSGRGVGMDVVREKTRFLGGTVSIVTFPGRGTKFDLVLPVNLSIVTILLVRAGEEIYALPGASVDAAIKIDARDIRTMEGRDTLRFRNMTIPVITLSHALGLGGDGRISPSAGGKISVAILSRESEYLACVVDEIRGERDALLKPLGGYLASLHAISGATVADDGSVVLLLHVPDLFSAVTAAGRRPVRAAAEGRAQGARSRSILLVEDSLVTREMEKALLESLGFTVDEAQDGVEALQKLRSGSYDLVLTDLQMPQMDGYELTKRIRSENAWKSLPVIMVTTLASAEDRRKGVEAGADAYLTKSEFSRSILLDTLRRLLP